MDWHRQFGLVLIDYFTGTPFEVELEKDLSIKQQYLDVVIVRKGKGRLREPLPDGLEDLADHNLITFKSHHESLDDWALMELTGHYVNYRKQVSPTPQKLLPASAFRLYAVCSRFPHNLANETTLERLNEGVYDCRRGSNRIRVIVTGQLAKTTNNAAFHLFSDQVERVKFGQENYRPRTHNTTSVLQQVFRGYRQEGLPMPYTMADFQRDYAKEHFKDLTPEEQAECLESVPAAVVSKRIKKFSPRQLRELLASLSAEEIAKALPQQDVERILKQRKKNSTRKK